jgi:hypothetical protein
MSRPVPGMSAAVQLHHPAPPALPGVPAVIITNKTDGRKQTLQNVVLMHQVSYSLMPCYFYLFLFCKQTREDLFIINIFVSYCLQGRMQDRQGTDTQKTCSSLHTGWWWSSGLWQNLRKEAVCSLNQWYLPTSQHSITTQKTNTDITTMSLARNKCQITKCLYITSFKTVSNARFNAFKVCGIIICTTYPIAQ